MPQIRSWLFRVIVVCVSLGLTATLTPQHAGAQDSHGAIQKLLRDAWDVTPSARRLADEIHSGAAPSDPHLAQLVEAYRLALMKQRRYPDALRSAQASLESNRTNAQLRWAEIWLLLVNKKHEAALHRCVNLVAPSDETEVIARTPGLLESIGAAVGFLEGPARKGMPPATLDQSIAKIVAALSEEELVALQRGRKLVADDYQQRQRESMAADDVEVQQNEAARATRRGQVEQDRQRLAEEQTSIDQRSQTIDAEIAERASQLRQREADANDAAIQLADQAGFLRSRLLLIGSDLARLDLQISQTNDPTLQGILIAQRNNLFRLRQVQFADLRAIESQLDSANRNLAFARRDRANAMRQASRQQSQLERSQKVIEKKRTKLARQESDLASPDAKASARSRVARKKAISWSSYYPYPLEKERQMLLDSI